MSIQSQSLQPVDRIFERILDLARSRGQWTTKDRLVNIKRLADQIGGEDDRPAVDGVFVEMGVARGCSATVLAHLACLHGRKLFLVDNFQGLPAPTREDGPDLNHLEGHCKGDEHDVRQFIHEAVPDADVEFIVGDFGDSAPVLAAQLLESSRRIALLHLDGDWYRSTKICLDHVGHLVAPGGVVVIDDYGWANGGCRQAVHEWLDANRLNVTIDRCGPYQGSFFMPA